MKPQGIKRPRGRPRKLRTESDKLRERVKARVGFCECCRRPLGSIAAAAKAAGVPHSSLHQFLTYDKPLSGGNSDKLYAWLDDEP